MKNSIVGFTSIIIVLLVALFYSPESYANNTAKNICDYVAADDKKRLRSLLKSERIKLRTIFKDVTCNGKNLLIFAASRNSDSVGEMIIRKLPKKTLRTLVAELTTVSSSLGELAKKRSV